MWNQSVIVDANRFHDFFDDSSSCQKLLTSMLVQRTIKMAIGGEKQRVEMGKSLVALQAAAELSRIGMLDRALDADVDAEEASLEKNAIVQSDDQHVLALARCSRGRVLVSNDKNLIQDFKNKDLISNPRGFVYKNDDHWDSANKLFGS